MIRRSHRWGTFKGKWSFWDHFLTMPWQSDLLRTWSDCGKAIHNGVVVAAAAAVIVVYIIIIYYYYFAFIIVFVNTADQLWSGGWCQFNWGWRRRTEQTVSEGTILCSTVAWKLQGRHREPLKHSQSEQKHKLKGCSIRRKSWGTCTQWRPGCRSQERGDRAPVPQDLSPEDRHANRRPPSERAISSQGGVILKHDPHQWGRGVCTKGQPQLGLWE